MPAERLAATVVIATYNRAGWLDGTLASLMRMDCRQPWDVIVIDNNSTDETPHVIAKYAAGPIPVLPLFEPRQGKSTALNTALEHARGDIIAFTDDDVDVDAQWLTTACDLLDANPEADYVGGGHGHPASPGMPAWLLVIGRRRQQYECLPGGPRLTSHAVCKRLSLDACRTPCRHCGDRHV